MDNATGPDSGQDTTALVSVQVAAAHLGITVEATRKRLQRGQLRGVRRGGRWLVDVAGQDHDTDRTAGQDETRTRTRRDGRTGPGVQALVDQLRGENDYLRDRLRSADEERAELRRMLNLEQQTVRALTEGGRLPELPAGSPEPIPFPAREEGATAQASVRAPQEPVRLTARRPWWRRLFGG